MMLVNPCLTPSTINRSDFQADTLVYDQIFVKLSALYVTLSLILPHRSYRDVVVDCPVQSAGLLTLVSRILH